MYKIVTLNDDIDNEMHRFLLILLYWEIVRGQLIRADLVSFELI